MSRSRKNAGIIGKIANVEPTSKSGVWSVDDSYLIKGPEKQNLKRNLSYRLDENPFVDKYNNSVALQFSDLHFDDHILKDKSDYAWDEYYAAVSYTRPMSSLTYHGPRYRDWSTKFHDNSGYSIADAASLRFGTGAFTLEFWIKLERYDSTEYYVLSKGTLAARTSGGTGWTVYVSTTRTIGFYDGLSNISIATTSTLTMDQWYHVAIVRNSTATNDTKIYLDGALAATGTSTGNFTDTNALIVGYDRASTTTTSFSGKITDIRLNNNAVYSGAFTKPSVALTMTDANTVFSHSMLKPHHDTIPSKQAQGLTLTLINNTTNIERVVDSPFFVSYPKLTGHGSHSIFNYSTNGSYKIYEGGPNATALRFGTNPFTIECWIKPAMSGISNVLPIAGKGTGNAGAGTGWTFRISTSGYLTWDDGTTTIAAASGGIVAPGGWYHVAAVREGTGSNQFKMYLNGALVYTGTVSTNYTNSTELRIFNSKADQYSFWGWACGLRISNTAKYTNSFDVESTTFIDSSMSTTFHETMLLVGTTGTTRPRPALPGPVNVGYSSLALVKRGNEYSGSKTPFSPKGTSWCCYNGGSTPKIVAVEGNSSFQFGTGDFSIEFWWQPKYSFDTTVTRRTLLDTRSSWADTGISIDISGWRSISVQSSGKCLLQDVYNKIENGVWYHICLQRVNGLLALYVDGNKIQECAYSSSMSSGASKLTIFNQTLGFGQTWSTPSFISDLRIVKGSAAYALNNKNPSNFILPTSPLSEVSNTVFFLSAAAGGIIKDSATGSTNNVTIGGRNESDFTSAWNVYPSSYGPYLSNNTTNIDTTIVGDTHGGSTTDGARAAGHNNNTNTRSNFVWITHLVKPWTIELWVHANEVNPATPTGGQSGFQTAGTAGQEGFQIVTHQNSARTNAWGFWNFSLYTQHNSGIQTIATSAVSLKPHSWNHLAVVFDPTKTNKLALWANGVRVANSTGFTTPGQKSYHYDDLTYSNFMSNPRISNIARYNNDSTTYTIPTTNWNLDANTVLQGTWEGLRNTSFETTPLFYGGSISYKNKKFGTASWKFSNKESGFVDRINLPKGGFNTLGMMNHWGDFTFECWAQWWDASAGGKNPFATYGNVLFHYANNLTIGITPAGVWQFKHQSGGATTPTVNQTLSTSVTAATTTSQTWDHIVMVRRQGNIYFYINGIYQGLILMADYGTPTGLAANYSSSYNESIGDPILGCDYAVTNATTGWTGFVQDVRFTSLARYDTDSSNTMVHIGTTTPALPKDLLQSTYSPITSTVGSMFLYGAYTSGNKPYYYTASNSNLTLDGDWTIECFVKRNTKYDSATRDLIVGSLNGDWGLHFGNYAYQNNITFYADAWNTGGQNFNAANNCIANSGGFDDRDQQWYHIALTRSGTTLTIYINGVANGTATIPSISGISGSSQTQWKINNTVNGHVSSIRYTKSVVYTGNFTAPNTTLTSLANTQLLIHPFTADKKVLDYGPNNIELIYSTGDIHNLTVSASGPFGTFSQPYSN